MKKLIAFFLTTCMIFCLFPLAVWADGTAEAAVPEVTIEGLLAANTREAIFSRHDTMLVHREDEFGEATTFLTEEYAYDADARQLFDSTDNWRLFTVNHEDAFAFDWYAMADGEREEMIWKPEYLFPYYNEEVMLKEEITDVAVNEDGSLTVTLLLGAEDFAAFQEAYGNPLPEEYAGMESLFVATVDAGTLEALVTEEYTVLGEEQEMLCRTELTYDAEIPEECAEMLSLAEEFRTAEPENPRTVTMIYDAGTEKEESFSVVTDRKFRVVPILREGYELYSDPEGTELFVGSDEVTDATIYAFVPEQAE